MRCLVYYVAAGPKHRRLARCSIGSLQAGGYRGDVHLHTDGDYRPLAGVRLTAASMSRWDAMRAKATLVASLRPADYDAILFLDADTLITGDLTPTLGRIAANPDKLFLPIATGCNLLATRGLARLLADEQRASVSIDQPMLDSYAVGFAPTPGNLMFMAAWDAANDVVPAEWEADAFGLNLALVTAGRLGDVAVLNEAERLNGHPSPGTTIEHYVHGAADRMPAVYRHRFGEDPQPTLA